MRNSMFAFLMVSALIFSSCGGNETQIIETAKQICGETAKICNTASNLCNTYQIPEACKIVNNVCYYSNQICSFAVISSDEKELKQVLGDLKILNMNLERISTSDNFAAESGNITNVLNQLVVIEKKLSD